MARDDFNLFDPIDDESEAICPHGNVAMDCEMDCVCGDSCDSHNEDGSCRMCGCVGYDAVP